MHDIFIVDHGNRKTINLLLEQFPHAQCVAPRDRRSLYIEVASKAVTRFSWILDDRYNYSNFDFAYTPPWHQADQIHVWQTDTVLINNKTLLENIGRYKTVQDFEYICWHNDSIPMDAVPDIIIWDFGGHQQNLDHLKTLYPHARVLRYFGTHFEMMKKSCNYVNTEDFWILSSCCDYICFDPAWRPQWHEEANTHCWPSGTQKFGDTFYVNKANFLSQSDAVEKLEYIDSIYWKETGYNRLAWPINYLDSMDIYTAVKTHKFSSAYEYFVAPGSTLGSTVDPNLWEKRSLIAYNRNGHVSLCSRDVLRGISSKFLDYPYIQYHKCEKSTQMPQDIFFISYDEKDADINWEKLKSQQPSAKRLHGIEGMINALKTAADASSTPWFYAVFAKTEIASEFKFDFNPNYLDTPGNYIFQAYNRVTDYTYGHGAVILYHSKTVSEATTWGYDFTTSFPYTHIPLMSCYNNAQTPWEAWRTSFREVLKLREMNTVESKYRLHRWCTVGNGPAGKWSTIGANDAVEYSGSLDQANDWHWLKQYFTNKHQQHQ